MGDNGQQTAPRAAICYSGRRKAGGDGLAMAEGRNADPSSARAAGSSGTEAEELQQHCLSRTGCRGKEALLRARRDGQNLQTPRNTHRLLSRA